MSTIKFTVEDSEAAEILRVILNSSVAISGVEVTSAQYSKSAEASGSDITPCQHDQPTDQNEGTNTPGPAPGVKPVGGTIFYIDNTADGVYEFLDVHGNVIENVQVGDRPYYYRFIEKEKGSKDKYYVYRDEVYTNRTWRYATDENYVCVYESAGTFANTISGKINTDRVMTRSNRACLTAASPLTQTIWYQLQQMNDAKAGGCDDWFIPSDTEIGKLRQAVKSGSITGGVIAGSSYEDSIFSNQLIWSSNEASSYFGAAHAWIWNGSYQCPYNMPKTDSLSMFITRAF